MRTQTKVFLWTIGLAGIAYTGYRYYKYQKEQKELEEKALTIEDIRAYHDSKKIEKAIEERADQLNKSIEDDAPMGLDNRWYKNKHGVYERKLSREEFLYGADYDPLTEEVVEDTATDGRTYTFIRKLEEIRLLNNREVRAVGDIIESVESYADSIDIMKANDVDPETCPHEGDTMEALDYYTALCLDRAGITNEEDRKKLITLSTYEYIPNVNDEKNQNVLANIRDARYKFFGVSPHTTWGSIAEVILYYAHMSNYHVGERSVEDYAHECIDYLQIDHDDRDVVINDVIISFFEHDRAYKPNYDGTYGIFGLPESQYRDAKCLNDEWEFFISNQTKLYGDVTSEDIV